MSTIGANEYAYVAWQNRATLIHWDKSLDPETAAHGMAKFVRMVGNKVPKTKGLFIIAYHSAAAPPGQKQGG